MYSEFIALIASMIAIIVSIITWKESFVLNHRPYVWAVSFTDKNTGMPHPELMALFNSNAHARITKKVINDYMEENGKITHIPPNNAPEKEDGGTIMYCLSDKVENGYYNPNLITYVKHLTVEQTLYRHIKINYEMITSNIIIGKKYYFEGKWKYTINDNNWREVFIKAN